MAKFKVSLVKASAAKKAGPHNPKASPVADFVLVDNQNDTCTVNGVDAAGNPVDISGVATLAVSSSDTSVLTVDAPVNFTFKMTATGKLSTVGSPVGITAVATWIDGSQNFSMTLPVDVVSGPAGGIVIVPGTPVANP